MYQLNGKTALVTGTASQKGIGYNVALRLAQEGVNVAVTDLPMLLDNLKGLVKQMEQEGVQGLALGCDVTDGQQVSQLVEKVLAKFKKIDILVNCHGIQGPLDSPVTVYPLEDWNKVLAVNLTGVFLCCKAVAKEMVKRNKGGKIVNIASRAGKVGRPGHAAYSASKFGVIGLTQSLALELAEYRINVNSVCPNTLATGLTRGEEIEKKMKELNLDFYKAADVVFADVIKAIPFKRLGTTEDMANMVLFLCSSQADYITGQAMNVNGGMLMY